MRPPSISWGQAAECLSECARQAVYCGVSVCERLAAAHHLCSPYPPLDAVIAAPAYARRRQ